MDTLLMFDDRRSAPAFWVGCLLVVAGVVLHLPMFLMARDMNYSLVDMPMDQGMLWGMALITAGCVACAFGLQPKASDTVRVHERIVPPEDAPLTKWHWLAGMALAISLVIDIMKPASLGFVTPGMQVEYRIGSATVSILPFAALCGTTLGSFLWGALADVYGRRATILLSAVIFVGTSICGAMPSLWWNVFMCFVMGVSAGGMLPVAYALLAEIMPTRHRGWSLVVVGGIGAIGGYLAASGLSALLQPLYGWRIMWFLNLPSGLLLIALCPLIPESARFLLHIGRHAEAHAILRRFGSATVPDTADWDEEAEVDHSHLPPIERRLLGTTVALSAVALSWGFVNFGLLLWLPGELIAEGRDMGLAAAIIARSTFIAVPVVAIAAVLYTRWSTKGALVTMICVTATGLISILLRESGFSFASNPVLDVALLIVGSTGMISILLPYTAESYPLRVRGRATGWVAGCTKSGGLICQGLSALSAVPVISAAAAGVGLSVLTGLALILLFGRETKGRDLRELEMFRHGS